MKTPRTPSFLPTEHQLLQNKDFLVLLIRLFLGYIFFSAGVCKLTGGNFGQLIGPPWLIEALAKHQLGFFAQVVAGSQVVCGLLLFTQRLSTLGAVMLVPMNLSILAVTISQNWTGTPYVNAVFLLLNLLLLAYEHQKFTFLFSTAPPQPVSAPRLDPLKTGVLPWLVLVAGLLTMAVAPFHLLATQVLGMLTFTLTAALLLNSKVLRGLEKVMISLAVVNMVLVTLGMKSDVAPKMVVAVSGVLLLLLLANFWLQTRRNKAMVLG
ncbi:DoxX family protein [Rufibacter sp. LB8]|uniref:DoxX family protein n=1 Tax=Rufibacter sp. LB8 TaxID=2777781 RepID=UPI00178C64E4|nr:DoxX family protein [Rufibacter sp. LB8]